MLYRLLTQLRPGVNMKAMERLEPLEPLKRLELSEAMEQRAPPRVNNVLKALDFTVASSLMPIRTAP